MSNNSFIDFVKKYKKVIICGMLFSIALYSFMMSMQLTNTFDGLCHQNYHHAGVGELASGRWVLSFVDKLLMGLHADPLTSIISLLLFSVGFVFILDLFDITSSLQGFICFATFASSAVVSITLSYRYTSTGYALSFLFAAISIWSSLKLNKIYIAIIVSGLFLGMSMGCYQTYIAVFAIVAVFYIILACSKKQENILWTIIRIASSALLGGIVYFGALKVFLKIYNASLSDYNNIGATSLNSVLANLFGNFANSYKFFYSYFFGSILKTNRLTSFGIYYLVFAVLALLIIYLAIKAFKSNKINAVILAIATCLIPIACNAYMLISADKLELQMGAGLAMLIPLIFIAIFNVINTNEYEENRKILSIAKSICIVVLCIVLCGNSLQVWFDQDAMYEGTAACESMLTQVVNDLKQQNLLSSDYRYYFIGSPVNNKLFYVSDIYYCANAYAQMGNFWTSGDLPQLSYNGFIKKRMGINLLMPYGPYEQVSQIAGVKTMPEYPKNGYISKVSDDTVVIKISEFKVYSGESKYTLQNMSK